MRTLVVLATVGLLALQMLQGRSAGATFAVNSTADETDVLPGDGLCRTASGACTLRAAVQEANASAGPDTIVLPAGTIRFTATGRNEDAAASGDLDVTSDVSVLGAGQAVTVVDAARHEPVFHVHAGGSLRLEGLTLTGGLSPRGAGAGLAVGNYGTATIVRVTMTLNGPYSSTDYLELPCSQSTVENHATMTIESSRIAGNNGRGVTNVDGGSLAVRTTTIDGNDVNNCGGAWAGGVFNGSGATLDVTDSAVTRNTAQRGGGVVNLGTITLTNSTVSNNNSLFAPMGIWASEGTLTLRNATVAENPPLRDQTGQPVRQITGSARLVNSIVARPGGGGSSIANCEGTFESLGHNLDDGDTCGFRGPGDLVNTAAGLDPLADNGGPTLTHALGEDSPAVDAADPAYCPPTDQRGVARPQVAACDIGAFERQPSEAPPVATPTPTARPSSTPVAPTATPRATSTPSPTTVPAPVPPPGPNRLILPVLPNAGSPN